jgi:hypothetical protein
VFDKDKVGKDTSLGKAEVGLIDLKGAKGKWLTLQVTIRINLLGKAEVGLIDLKEAKGK